MTKDKHPKSVTTSSKSKKKFEIITKGNRIIRVPVKVPKDFDMLLEQNLEEKYKVSSQVVMSKTIEEKCDLLLNYINNYVFDINILKIISFIPTTGKFLYGLTIPVEKLIIDEHIFYRGNDIVYNFIQFALEDDLFSYYEERKQEITNNCFDIAVFGKTSKIDMNMVEILKEKNASYNFYTDDEYPSEIHKIILDPDYDKYLTDIKLMCGDFSFTKESVNKITHSVDFLKLKFGVDFIYPKRDYGTTLNIMFQNTNSYHEEFPIVSLNYIDYRPHFISEEYLLRLKYKQRNSKQRNSKQRKHKKNVKKSR